MANIFCSKCGHQIEESTTVCPSCGKQRMNAQIPSATALAHAFADFGAAGFFKTLLDTSFKSFITLKLIKFFYILGGIAITVAAILFGFSGFTSRMGLLLSWNGSFLTGLLTLFIGAPIMWFIWMVFLRVMMEFISAFFRIAENTSKMVNLLEKQ
jgi:uncharacterized membrane protein